MHRFRAVAVVVATLAVALPGSAEAQIGGLGSRLKDKVKERMGGAPETAVAPADAEPVGAPTLPAGMVMLDEAGVGRLLAGLRAEVADLDAVAAELAAAVPRPDWDACSMEALWTPEGEAATEAFNAALERWSEAPADTVRLRAYEEAGQGLYRVQRARCGPGPDEAARLEEELAERPVLRGAERAGMTEDEYAVAKERAVPFCAQPEVFEAGEAGTLPGDGNATWVWTAEEVAALLAGCGELAPLLAEVG